MALGTGRRRFLTPDQGSTYAAFTADQVDHERKRRESVYDRGNRTITVSGILIGLTVTLGLGTAHGAHHEFVWAGALGSLGVLAFVTATALALVATRPNAYKVVSEDAVMVWLRDHWKDTETSARSRVAQHQALTLASLRKGNNRRTNLVNSALWVQLGGLVLVSGAVAVGLFLH